MNSRYDGSQCVAPEILIDNCTKVVNNNILKNVYVDDSKCTERLAVNVSGSDVANVRTMNESSSTSVVENDLFNESLLCPLVPVAKGNLLKRV